MQSMATQKTIEFLEKAATVLAIVLFCGTVLPSLLTGDRTGADQDSPGAMMVFVGLYVIIIGMVCYRPRLLAQIPTVTPMMSLLTLAVFASVAWSIYPDVTMRRAVALLFTTVFGIYMALRFSFVDILKLLVVGTAITMFLSFAAIVAMPDIGLDSEQHVGAWKGIFWQKNVTGRIMVTLITCLLWLEWLGEGRRWVNRGLLALAFVLLVMCRSGTSLITAVVVLAVMLGAGLVRSNIRVFMLTLTVAGLGILAAILAGPMIFEAVLTLLGRDAGLTGRDLIWEHVLATLDNNLILGFGFGAYWYGPYAPGSYFVMNWGITSAHNGWLELMLDLGVLGLVIMALLMGQILVQAFVAMRYSPRPMEPAWALAIACTLLTISVSESVFLGRHSLTWVVLVIAAVRLVMHRRTLHAAPPLHPAMAMPPG
ncbi:O-antigen ligase family protein [Azospirillum sp.]|uniref:O-antigen ligase family protein n=1 Tax=Azospirillum sp. TaxID=34012 RepID=UPI002D64C609|nr:O-antigen ligase family protein [Azospirillum sp.]HYD67856.1 O-antigen ligase family protein [Azospirillum sp.]